MSLSRNLEAYLAKAKRKEEKYDWLNAIDFYKKASCFALELEDFLRAGEIEERIGYCFYRAAFQGETNEDFKKWMQLAVEAYNRAAERFDKAKKRVRGDYCKALAI